MQFKPVKLRSQIIKRGKITDNFKMTREEMPYLTNNPIKCLREWFDVLLTDKSSMPA